MKRSTERILTTHTGSLPRPADLVTMIRSRERKEEIDEKAFDARVEQAVKDIVKTQIDNGLTVVNDGEQGKASYSTYITRRLSGFGGTDPTNTGGASDLFEYPDYMKRMNAARGGGIMIRPSCDGPIEYVNTAELQKELDDFKEALGEVSPADAFLSAASPGVIAVFLTNFYYKDHEAFIWAMANAMKTEYDAIHKAGFVLQIDCPDLAMGRHSKFRDKTLDEFKALSELHVEALNYATRDIPEDAMRIHLCWGNYEGPHHHDVPLKEIVDIVLKARPAGISLEASNPRHAHEWNVWQDTRLPDGKVLIPGVIDSTTNFIEHPELVAQRIEQFAEVVGKENVVAGTDCGFSTGAGSMNVDPAIVWAKFRAMAEGAEIASKRLWK